MARVKRGTTTKAKHKRILDQAKGYYGRRKNTIRIARQAVEKAGQYAYRDRKVKKRSFRALLLMGQPWTANSFSMRSTQRAISPL